MSPRQIADLFFDYSVRIENIVWMAANFDRPCDALDDLIADEKPEMVAELLGISVKVIEAMRADDFDPAEVLSAAARAGRNGFLVEAATPIPTEFLESGGHMFSWGWSQTKWFYTESLDAAFAQSLVAWKESVVESERAKHERTKQKPVKRGRAKR